MALRPRVVDGAPDVERMVADETGIRLGDFGAQQGASFGVGQGGVELAVVEFVVAEGGEELEGAVARQFALIDVTALAMREGLADDGEVEAGGQQQPAESQRRLAPRQRRRIEAGDELAFQRQRGDAGDDGEHAEQAIDRVGLDDVVDDFLGIDQVIDGDEIEADAEFVPEQPFGGGDEEHGEEADAGGDQQQRAVPAGAPQFLRADQQVKGGQQRGIDQEGQVVHGADGEQAQDCQETGIGLGEMGGQQQTTDQEENQQPAGENDSEEAGLGVAEERHRLREEFVMARSLRRETSMARERIVKKTSRNLNLPADGRLRRDSAAIAILSFLQPEVPSACVC